ncbi:MAG: ABC transporter ATP-binding protein [Albidovulum sp.]|nr:ABC transporter ATP-binding protein [Albidovulum sp.]
MSEVRFSEVSKRFGGASVFERIDLTCPEHKYLCLLGPSGCGKTTLMRLAAGLESPDEGDVMIGGRRVNDLPPADRNIGMAFQNYALYPMLSVRENLTFPLRAPVRRRAWPESKINSRVDDIAQLLRIDWLLDRPIATLSGGQQQRVALGRALIRNPPVLLLDEPITHLDARLRYEMRAELKTLHAKLHTTTIHVTHDQQEALAVADLIAVMNAGRIEQVGPPVEVYRNPNTAFVAGFVGDPPMSVVRMPLRATEGCLQIDFGGRLLDLPEKFSQAFGNTVPPALLIGIRPSSVNLVPSESPAPIPARVYSHEMVGRELQLMLSVGDGLIRYRSPDIRHFAVGDKVACDVNLGNARLFDAETGVAILI